MSESISTTIYPTRNLGEGIDNKQEITGHELIGALCCWLINVVCVHQIVYLCSNTIVCMPNSEFESCCSVNLYLEFQHMCEDLAMA